MHDMLHSGAMGYMIAGGIFMWPILILGVVALAVIIERYRALLMLNTQVRGTPRGKVRELLEADRVEEASICAIANTDRSPRFWQQDYGKYLLADRLGYATPRRSKNRSLKEWMITPFILWLRWKSICRFSPLCRAPPR